MCSLENVHDLAAVEANNQQITGDCDIPDAADSQSNSYNVVLSYLLTYSLTHAVHLGTRVVQGDESKTVPPNDLGDPQFVQGTYMYMCPYIHAYLQVIVNDHTYMDSNYPVRARMREARVE